MNPKIKSIPLSEREVTTQVKQFLEAKGWTYLRLQAGLLRTADKRFMRVGSKGMPDAVALYGCYELGYAKTIFLEFKKSTGGKLSKEQIAWHLEASKKRLAVMVVSDFKDFKKKYESLYVPNGLGNDITIPVDML